MRGSNLAPSFSRHFPRNFFGSCGDFCIFACRNMTEKITEYFKTQPVLKAWLFGSFARGEETENSDVDILVEFDRSLPIGLFAYVRMCRELGEKIGRKVDLVEEGTLRPAAQLTASRDLKVIYERSNYHDECFVDMGYLYQ